MLGAFPRERIAHLPTPLEPLSGLQSFLGETCPRLFIKRDDCTGLSFGGNKTRKLEFLVGQAKSEGNDTLITFGAAQSNHVRQTAAAAAKCGLNCIAILVEQVPYEDAAYQTSGNLLLDKVLGAEIHLVPNDEGAAVALGEVLERLGHEGRSALIIPPGGSTALGSLGYVDCAAELKEQCTGFGIEPKAIVLASSTGGTQAGLVAGAAALDWPVKIIAFDVYKGKDDPSAIQALAQEVSDLIEGGPLHPNAVELRRGVIGDGNGLPTPQMKEALALMAAHEGILMDPVYSGKALAGLIQMIRAGEFGAEDDVIFLHTGGAPGLFAYEKEWR